VKDDFNSAKSEVNRMIVELSKIKMALFEGDAHMAWMKHSKNLNESLKMMKENNDLKSLRTSFVLLSSEMISLAKTFRANSETLFIQHCPMANNDKGASWISTQNEVRNPYFGAKMLGCGTTIEKVKGSTY
jgi:Cu(I)/Ag(I) efflux system membrane fusion protein